VLAAWQYLGCDDRNPWRCALGRRASKPRFRIAREAAARPALHSTRRSPESGPAVLSVWQYLGCGYLNPGDVLLAAGVEASLRAAREALLELRRGPP
jgi:hypothetical protein